MKWHGWIAFLPLAFGCQDATRTADLDEAINARNAFARFGLTSRSWPEIQGVTAAQVGPRLRVSVPDHSSGDIAARRPWLSLPTSALFQDFSAPLSIWSQAQSARLARPADVTDGWSLGLSAAEKLDIVRNGGHPAFSEALWAQMRNVHDGFEFSVEIKEARARLEQLSQLVELESQILMGSLFVVNSRPSSEEERTRLLTRVAERSETMRLEPFEGDTVRFTLSFQAAWEEKTTKYLSDLERFAQGETTLPALLGEHQDYLAMMSALQLSIWEALSPMTETRLRESDEHAAAIGKVLEKYPEVLRTLEIIPEPSMLVPVFNPEVEEEMRRVTERTRLSRAAGSEREKLARTLAPFAPATAAAWRNWGRTYRVGDYAFAGTCHGEALASLMSPSISKLNAVRLTGANYDLVFTARDIESLYGKAWGTQSSGSMLYAGQRCRVKEINEEGERPGTIECRDVNPATFHLALVELLHDQKIPFAMDGAVGHEVWNSTVQAFEFSFPEVELNSGEQVSGGTPIPVEDVEDPWGTHRAPGTRYLLSVAALLNDSEELAYTLELNDKLELIGGEWETGKHPDFLWRPGPEVKLEDGPVSLPVLQRLVECAQREPDQTVEVALADGEIAQSMSIPVVGCSLQ